MSLNSFSSLKSSQHFFLKLINPDQRKAAECGNRSNVHGTYHDLVLGQVFGLSVCGLGFLTCHMRDTDWPPQPLPALTCDLWPGLSRESHRGGSECLLIAQNATMGPSTEMGKGKALHTLHGLDTRRPNSGQAQGFSSSLGTFFIITCLQKNNNNNSKKKKPNSYIFLSIHK